MEKEYRELESTKLLLRKVVLEDARKLWDNIYSNFELYKYYHPIMFSGYDEYENLIKSYEERYSNGNFFRWGIVLKENNELTGMVALHHYDYQTNIIKIGYIMMRNYRNKGIATEAVGLVLKYVFEELKLFKVEANVTDGNEASLRVLEKNNFYFDRIKKSSYRLGDQFLDQHIYVLRRNDYEGQKKS